jgi:hypothetical protein
MTQMEIKSKILFKYHKDMDFWRKLLGEFCEGTNGFTRSFSKRCTLNGIKIEITWANGSWDIKEI